ncbi:hypothetical protein LSAT2_020800 [Lamellibrachia satsuma]|nr:hypothetical protein LSAT2_020800 [Lamellibrachia satsuma]
MSSLDASHVGLRVCVAWLLTMWTDHVMAVDELKSYSATPRQPVKANSPYAQTMPPEADSDSYLGYDLGIYARYYSLYSTFVGTRRFDNINNDSDVCMNYEVRWNDTTLGLFLCPMPFEPPELRSCCGERYAEFCCYNDTDSRHSQMLGALVLGAILAFVTVQGIICWCLLGKRGSSSRKSKQVDQQPSLEDA